MAAGQKAFPNLRIDRVGRAPAAKRELRIPGKWARDTFGERPDEQRAGEAWESGVRRVASYRSKYEIADSSDAIGPRPETGEQRQDWERARRAIARTGRQLGRDVGVEHDSGLEIGL